MQMQNGTENKNKIRMMRVRREHEERIKGRMKRTKIYKGERNEGR